MSRRCVTIPLAGGGYTRVQTSGRLTPEDLAAINTFHDLLKKDPMPDQTQPDQTPEPAPVDLASVQGWVFVLQRIKAQRAALDDAEKQARSHIESLMGDAVDGRLEGQQVVRWIHTAGARRFDSKAFAKAHPKLAAEFTRVGDPGRRFELVDPTAADQ